MTDSNHETDPKQETEDQTEAQGAAFELEEDQADSSRDEAPPADAPEAPAGADGAHKITADGGEPPVFGLDEEEAAAVPPELRDGSGTSEEYTSGVGIQESVTANGGAAEENTDIPLIVDLEEAKRVVETLLFVTHEPLRPRDISMVFRGVENVNAKVVRKLLAELIEEYEDRTIQIQEVAEGYRMSTRMDMSPWVRRFFKNDRKWRVSNAGLETLAIIAYKQPITKAEVEHIRRVDCGGVIHTLLERRMLRVLGRRDVVGKPIVYGTTPQFLEHFGFKNLTDMPKPDEFDVEFGGRGPGGDILPIEEEMGLEGVGLEGGGHANGSSNGEANGHASSETNGHAVEGEEEDTGTASVETASVETVSSEIETDTKEESEEEIQ